MTPHVVKVIGSIATGKTTLTKVLAAELGFSATLEQPADNPFLPLMTTDPARWCFANQCWFANEASASLRTNGRGNVSDHSIEEVISIHSPVFKGNGWLDRSEFALLQAMWPNPDRGVSLYVHLIAEPSTLVTRVRERMRGSDRLPDVDYLERVERARARFVRHTSVPVLQIRSDALDFRHPSGAALIADGVRTRLAI
jgi:deoxyguanosine kinase